VVGNLRRLGAGLLKRVAAPWAADLRVQRPDTGGPGEAGPRSSARTRAAAAPAGAPDTFDQEILRPVILALVGATYQTAVARVRMTGPLPPRLFVLMGEAANIAPARGLSSWPSQCGTAQISIPPLAEAHERRPSHRHPGRGARRECLRGRLTPHPRGRASQGGARTVASTDWAGQRDPRLPRPAARRCAGARLVRGPSILARPGPQGG
jgi:hypothetical protein